jgi:hypothetical protein
MQFDDLDKKIQEAAERYHPVYDEQAWKNMEKLLDKNLPQQKKDRRYLLLLLFTFIGIVVGFILTTIPSDKTTNKTGKVITPKVETIKPGSGKSISATGNNTARSNIKKDNFQPGVSKKTTAANKPVIHLQSTNATSQQSTILAFHRGAISPTNGNGVVTNNLSGFTKKGARNGNSSSDIIAPNNNVKDDGNDGVGALSPITDLEQKSNHDKDKAVAEKNNRPIINQAATGESKHETGNLDKSAVSSNTKISVQKGRSILDRFTVNLSSGLDVSAVNINKIGRLNAVYGAGIGYSVSDKWKVRTGFYTVSKVYNASPSDYHPPTKFWDYYPHLENISATCKVYEVPIIVDYIFKNKAKSRYFASAGLSSYFMHKETYHYSSETPTAGYRYDTFTVSNQNRHYLSSLRLSAGYQRKLSATISITAEPYLNLPLGGIGFGKVKLNSAGMLITVGIKPFGKK